MFSNQVIAFRIVGFLNISYSLPASTAALLHKDPDVVQAALRKFEQWFNLLQLLEKRALADKFLSQLLASLYWPDMQWVRMILLGLWEAKFEVVPAWVYKKVLAAWRGITFNQPTELLNRELRNMERVGNMRNDVGRKNRWLHLVQSKVLLEADRGKVTITQAARVAAAGARLPDGIFDPESTPCSLGEHSMNRLTTGPWTTKAPQVSNVLVLAWWAMNIIGDDISKLKRMWLALLCTPGTAICNKDNSKSGVVLFSCLYGVLVLKLKAKKLGDDHVISLQCLPQVYDFFPVTDQDEWSVADLAFQTPGQVVDFYAKLGDANAPVLNTFLKRTSGAKSLVHHSSDLCFKGLTQTYLSKLWTRLQIPNPKSGKPATVRALCEGMVRYVQGDVGEPRIKEILAKRFDAESNEISTLLAEESNKDLVAECFDECDAAEINAKVDDLVATIAAHKKSYAPDPSSSSGQASSSSGAASGTAGPSAEPSVAKEPPAKRLKPLEPFVSKFDIEQVKKLLPQIEGCKASLECQWDGRWRCTYPGVNPGFSKSFGASTSEKDALYQTLSWAWRCHFETGNGGCIYQYQWERYI